MSNARQEGYRKGGMQDRCDAGLEGCRKGGNQGMRDAKFVSEMGRKKSLLAINCFRTGGAVSLKWSKSTHRTLCFPTYRPENPNLLKKLEFATR